MVKQFFICLFLVFLGNATPAQTSGEKLPKPTSSHQDSFEAGENYGKIRPYKMTAIKTITITQNGVRSADISGDETPEVCANFVLTRCDVLDYFRHADRASSREYWETLSMSRCYAHGEIRFANGDHGKWMIDLERRGKVALSDGRNLYFYGRRAHAKVFDEANDILTIAGPRKDKQLVKLAPVKNVIFKPNGTYWDLSDDQKVGLCSRFALSENDVRDYFLRARIVDLPTYGSDLTISSCSLEGEIVFVNGDRGKWKIESARRGILVLSDGRTTYLDGKRATARAFDAP